MRYRLSESDGSSGPARTRDTAAVDFSIDCARAVAGGVGRRHKPCSRCKVAFTAAGVPKSALEGAQLRCVASAGEVDPEANRYCVRAFPELFSRYQPAVTASPS